MGEAMADQDIMHTADIMKAALPFIDSGNKGMVEFFMKIFDLMGSLKSLKSNKNVAAFGFEAGKFDMEGLLNGIKPVCNIREREVIDRILNFFNMKRMFEMYNKMMGMMQGMQDFGGFDFGNFGGNGNTGKSGDDTENVTSNFGGQNFESIFNSMGGNFSAQDKPESKTSDEADPPNQSFFGSDKEKAPQSNTGGKMNDKMFDMLKAMVPPEQMATFENLSMLLNTMSYDNNSKPEESKERNDV
jgi:hypothetical protein